MFYCARCNYSTSRRSSMKSHIERGNICPPVRSGSSREEMMKMLSDGKLNDNAPKKMDIQCPDCGQCFAHRQSKYAHIKNKRCKAKKLEQFQTIIDKQNETIESQKTLVKQQKRVIANQNKTIQQIGKVDVDISKWEPHQNKGYLYLICPNRISGIYKIGITRHNINSYLKRYQDPIVVKIWYCFNFLSAEEAIKSHLRDKKMCLAPLREWFASDEDPKRLISVFDRMIKTYQ